MIRQFFTALTLVTTMMILAPNAQAMSDSATIILSETAAQLITGTDLNVLADDAASFIMSEGENASSEIVRMIDQMRSNDQVRSLKDELSDIALARAVLNEVEKEIQ